MVSARSLSAKGKSLQLCAYSTSIIGFYQNRALESLSKLWRWPSAKHQNLNYFHKFAPSIAWALARRQICATFVFSTNKAFYDMSLVLFLVDRAGIRRSSYWIILKREAHRNLTKICTKRSFFVHCFLYLKEPKLTNEHKRWSGVVSLNYRKRGNFQHVVHKSLCGKS